MNKELEALYKLNEIASGSLSVKENRYDLYELLKSALERKNQLETENAELKLRNEKLEMAWDIVVKKNGSQIVWEKRK